MKGSDNYMTQAVLLSKGTLIYDEEVCGENMFSNNEGKIVNFVLQIFDYQGKLFIVKVINRVTEYGRNVRKELITEL